MGVAAVTNKFSMAQKQSNLYIVARNYGNMRKALFFLACLSIIFCFTLFGSVVLFVTYAQNQYSAYAYNQYLRTTPVHFLYIRAGGRSASVFFCQTMIFGIKGVEMDTYKSSKRMRSYHTHGVNNC